MQLKRLLTATLIASGSYIPLVFAQIPPPSEQLDQLVANRQYEQAYDIAKAHLGEWEGDTQFDFLFGLAAIESGHPNEAVFAFERVANTASNATLRQRARLELARANLMTNNLVAAEELFNQVLAANPPQNVRDNIEAFLSLIEARRDSQRASVSWSIAPSFGHDDNINSATANGLIDTPLIGEIELNPEGLKTADDFADVTLGMAYKKPLTRDQTIDASLSFNRHDNLSTARFDMDYLFGDVSFSYGNESNRFRHSLQGQKLGLDGQSFQSTYRLNNSWQHASGNGWYQSLSAALATSRFDNHGAAQNNDLRDTNQIMLSAGLTKLSQSFTNSLTVFYADDKARQRAGEHNGRDFYGIAHSVFWRLSNKHTPYLRLSVQKTAYDSEHPVFFTKKRADTTMSGSAGWIWQYSRKFSVNGEMLYTESDSNIPLFEYSRFRYQAGFNYQL